jgi:hypothetical protein
MKLKVSRPVVYIGLAAIIGAAVYLYLTPAEVVKKAPPKKLTSKQSAGIQGILPEDYELKFPSVTQPGRDVFLPLVARTTNARAANESDDFGTNGWHLTGISIVNGQRMATVESSNGDLASLRLGQTFDGFIVRAISDSAVTIEAPDGRKQKLNFVAPTAVEPDAGRTIPTSTPSVPQSTSAENNPPAPATNSGSTNNNQRQRNRNQGN